MDESDVIVLVTDVTTSPLWTRKSPSCTRPATRDRRCQQSWRNEFQADMGGAYRLGLGTPHVISAMSRTASVIFSMPDQTAPRKAAMQGEEEQAVEVLYWPPNVGKMVPMSTPSSAWTNGFLTPGTTRSIDTRFRYKDQTLATAATKRQE